METLAGASSNDEDWQQVSLCLWLNLWSCSGVVCMAFWLRRHKDRGKSSQKNKDQVKAQVARTRNGRSGKFTRSDCIF